MKPPKNTKEVRDLIGIFNYYRYMWDKLSHLLHPLTALMPHKVKFKCTGVEQKRFDDNKPDICQDKLLAVPDFNTHFIIRADIRDYHLGALMSYNRKPISFYSHKLTGPQTQYTVT